MKTSVLIASINDPYLKRTVDEIRKTADGEVEFIVINDGGEYPSSLQDVIILNHTETLGRRVSFNEAARVASGDYLLITDPHCSMSAHWDTKMAESCGDKNLVFSVLWDIDPHTWERKGGAYLHVSMNKQYTEKWWPKKRLEECQIEEESMCFTGCGWMIKKDRYWEVGGYDEALGKYGWDGPEWSCKIWMNDDPGKVILRTDVVCGHIFGTNLKSKLYRTEMIPQAQYLEYMKKKWGTKTSSLVEYFAPVPDWHTKKGSAMSQGTERTVTLSHKKDFKDMNEKGEVIGRRVEYYEYVYHGSLPEKDVFKKYKKKQKLVRTEEWKMIKGKLQKVA